MLIQINILIQDSIGFDSRSPFPVSGFDWDKSVVIFGVDNGSSVHINNKKTDIVVQYYGTSRSGIFFKLFRIPKKIYNGSNSFLFVNATKVYQFKAKDSEINP